MNPLLRGIFEFLKFVTIVALRIYYPKAAVINQKKLHFDHPAILISNHPNTMLDPLHAASRVPRPVSFLANAGMFSTWITNWFFSTFYCIPIQRSKDKPDKNVNNEDSFAKADEFLGNGGILYIAPEGTSEMHRRLRGVKTGTARIALSAAAKKNFQLQLAIVPVGLTYEASNRFGSGVVVHAGDHLRIEPYRAAYEQDPVAAVRQLTQDIETRLQSLLIHTQDDAEERLLEQIETLLRQEQPLDTIADYNRSKAILVGLRRLEQEQSVAFARLREDLRTYFTYLAEEKLRDRGIAKSLQGRPTLRDYLMTTAGFPVFIYGLINNFFPAFLPIFLMRKLNLFPGYNATIKILAGLLTFPLFYGLQTYAIASMTTGSTWLVYLLSLPITGWLAWRYRKWIRPLEEANYFRRKPAAVIRQLTDLRSRLLDQISSMPLPDERPFDTLQPPVQPGHSNKK